jgi:hypothetical protein
MELVFCCGGWSYSRLTIGTSDHDMESLVIGIDRTTPLTRVRSGRSSDWVAVESALDISERSWVGASSSGSNAGITLKVNIEAEASADLVALG